MAAANSEGESMRKRMSRAYPFMIGARVRSDFVLRLGDWFVRLCALF